MMILKGSLTFATAFAAFSISPSLAQRAEGSDFSQHLSTRQQSSTASFTNGGNWTAAFEQAKALVRQMTIEEKVNITSGTAGPCSGNTGRVDRLNVPSFCVNDSPTGVGGTTGVSQFPSEVTVAASFDRDLFASRAAAIAEEFKEKGVNIWLGPVTGGPLGRAVKNGRFWETYGADEYLQGEASFLSVKASQEKGVVACSKHYILNEQETLRGVYVEIPILPPEVTNAVPPVSSNVDDRTFHELYLRPFAEAARAGTGTVMCSYNRINGTHACENSHTLNEILKGELNFQGAVVSDWGGTWSTAPSANAGLDVVMPGDAPIYSTPIGDVSQGDFFGKELIAAVKDGSVTESRLDDMVLRFLTPIMHFESDWKERKPTFRLGNLTMKTNDVTANHSTIIKRIGTESATLLKNDRANGGGLPLKSPESSASLAVIGEDAGPSVLIACNAFEARFGCPTDKNTGTLTTGSGSGQTIPPYVVDPLAAISDHVRESGLKLNVALENRNLSKVASQASISDAALVFVNAFQVEGVDRTNLMLMKDGEKVIKTTAANNNNTIVVIHSGGPTLMEEWIDHENITAVLFFYYPGQESGSSLTPLLWGETSPSGKLPMTIGKKEEDYPPDTIESDPFDPQSDFKEKLLIDYKWFDAKNIVPRFPFGFGLSYSTFAFGNASISSSFKKDGTSIQPTNEKFTDDQFDGDSLYDQVLEVKVNVTNTGTVKAAEVAQLYLEFPQSAEEPPSLLRGFEKLNLGAGKSGTATFSISRKDISIWDVVTQKWIIPKGELKFKVGNSSRDFKTSAVWKIE